MNCESVESLKNRIAAAKRDEADHPTMRRRAGDAAAEVARLEGLIGRAEELAADVSAVTRPRGVIGKDESGSSLAATIGDLNGRLNAARKESKAPVSALTALQLALKEAQDRDKQIGAGIFDKLTGRAVGQITIWPPNLDAKTSEFLQKQAESLQPGTYSSAVVEGEEQRRHALMDAIPALAAWKKQNDVQHAAIRRVRVAYGTGTAYASQVFRVVKAFERGAWCWRAHQVARNIFVPLAPDVVARELKKLPVQVIEGAMLAERLLSILPDGKPQYVIEAISENLE